MVENASERVLRVGAANGETVEAYRRARRAPADVTLQFLVSRASAAGLDAKPHLREVDPAEGIAAVARELAADVVVLGTRVHGGIHATIWGSVAERVLSLSDTSLVVEKHAAPSS